MSKEKEKVSVSEVERLEARIRDLEYHNSLLQTYIDKIKSEKERIWDDPLNYATDQEVDRLPILIDTNTRRLICRDCGCDEVTRIVEYDHRSANYALCDKCYNARMVIEKEERPLGKCDSCDVLENIVSLVWDDIRGRLSLCNKCYSVSAPYEPLRVALNLDAKLECPECSKNVNRLVPNNSSDSTNPYICEDCRFREATFITYMGEDEEVKTPSVEKHESKKTHNRIPTELYDNNGVAEMCEACKFWGTPSTRVVKCCDGTTRTVCDECYHKELANIRICGDPSCNKWETCYTCDMREPLLMGVSTPNGPTHYVCSSCFAEWRDSSNPPDSIKAEREVEKNVVSTEERTEVDLDNIAIKLMAHAQPLMSINGNNYLNYRDLILPIALHKYPGVGPLGSTYTALDWQNPAYRNGDEDAKVHLSKIGVFRTQVDGPVGGVMPKEQYLVVYFSVRSNTTTTGVGCIGWASEVRFGPFATFEQAVDTMNNYVNDCNRTSDVKCKN